MSEPRMTLIADPAAWDALVASLPGAHLLQTWEWGQFKARTGWSAIAYAWQDGGQAHAAALVLERSIPVAGFAARLAVMYAPKGPLLDWQDEALRARVLSDLEQLARRRRAIFVKIDPDVLLGTGIPGMEGSRETSTGAAAQATLTGRGWRWSGEQVQFRNSVIIDLAGSEDDLLARMKQKTRYNIRLAQKKGVGVRIGTVEDLPRLYQMYAETSVRDAFVIRDQAYYLDVWRSFMARGMAQPLVAEVDGEPVAGLLLYHFAGTAYYLYGMSREAHREKMPNYLLQWEAMRRARSLGCARYDLWGAPDVFDEQDSMWGVFRFKEGLGGEVARTLGAYDFPARPLIYRLYTQALPRLLDVMRRRGKARTRQEQS